MKPYISQPKGSASCGAYSIAYYLWETDKSEHVNYRDFVTSIYEKIKFGTNKIGMNEAVSNPEKMVGELNDNWNSCADLCLSSNSPLIPLAKEMDIETQNMDVLDKLRCGENKYAIIICAYKNQSKSMHFILVKYEDDTFKMLNSSAIYGNSTDNVAWEDFSVEPDGRLLLGREAPYLYTGAGILIH
ncbi:MAG: hypothetical protein Q4F66_05365 [Clostridium sp.]|nr:hypothetical protein [Clostridium sp.]